MDHKRNYGLDLFRILAMAMITILHLGKFRFNTLAPDNPVVLFSIGWFMETFCYCGVNCFALLTGYLSGAAQYDYDEKWFLKIFQLWVKILLWGMPIYLGAVILNPQINFSVKTFISCFLPYGFGWWYIYAYFGLLIFLPILSGFCNRFSLKSQVFAGLSIFAAFLIFTRVPTGNSFYLNNGYSCLWLMICFIFGQILKTWSPRFTEWKFSNCILIAGVILGGGLPFLSVMVYHFFKIDSSKIVPVSYISPFILLEAVCLLILFSQVKIKNITVQKVVRFLSVNSLGIYLFQCHFIIWGVVFRRTPPSHPSELLWKYPLVFLGIIAIGITGDYVVNRICSSSPVTAAGKKAYHLLTEVVSFFSFEKNARPKA